MDVDRLKEEEFKSYWFIVKNRIKILTEDKDYRRNALIHNPLKINKDGKIYRTKNKNCS